MGSDSIDLLVKPYHLLRFFVELQDFEFNKIQKITPFYSSPSLEDQRLTDISASSPHHTADPIFMGWYTLVDSSKMRPVENSLNASSKFVTLHEYAIAFHDEQQVKH
jgi:hypothetical protein